MPSTTTRLLGVATAAAVLAGLGQLPGAAAPDPARSSATSLEQATAGLDDLDLRGTALPSAAQKSAAAGLSGTVRWNRFGTPASISPVSGTLGAASSGDAEAAARSWLSSHASLFGMSASQMKALTLVRSQKLAGSGARAVLFRQDFGGPAPALGSMVTVGIGNGAVQYVSSSLVRTSQDGPGRVALPHGRLAQGRSEHRPQRSRRIPDEHLRQARLDPVQGSRLRAGAAGPPPLPRVRRRHRAPGLRGQRRRRAGRLRHGVHAPGRRRRAGRSSSARARSTRATTPSSSRARSPRPRVVPSTSSS